jgi:site-specific recombinase XerD
LIISRLLREELLAVLGAAREGRERDWLLFSLSYNHGLRVSEAVGLTADDVSEHGIRIVGLKEGESVVQPLIESGENLLNERKALLKFVFGMEGNQKIFSIGRRRAWELFRKYGTLSGLPEHKRHPHVLRHTCATDLTEKKVPLEQIQAWMRHKNLGSTGIYLRPTQEQVNFSVLAAMGA